MFVALAALSAFTVVVAEGHPGMLADMDAKAAGGRVIVSAGCEVPPDTTLANMRAFRAAIDHIFRHHFGARKSKMPIAS